MRRPLGSRTCTDCRITSALSSADRQIWRRCRVTSIGDRVQRQVSLGATAPYASVTMAATSSQSTRRSPSVSRYTPSQFENTPLAHVGGLKNRRGSAATISSWTPAGTGHHSEIRPSPLWLSWKYHSGRVSRTKKHGSPWLNRSFTSGSESAIRRTRSYGCNRGSAPRPIVSRQPTCIAS